MSDTTANTSVQVAVNYINSGHDPKEWVRQVVLPRIKRDAVTRAYIFPDPLIDLEYFAELHSWYKHLRTPMRFYPILRIGVEPRNSMQADSSDDEKDKDTDLHWAFIDESTLYTHDHNGYHYKLVPFAIMNNHYFYLNRYFNRYHRETSADSKMIEINKVTEQTVVLECIRIQDRITRILLEIDPNPPKPEHTTLISDNEILGDQSDSRVTIAGKVYSLHCISTVLDWK